MTLEVVRDATPNDAAACAAVHAASWKDTYRGMIPDAYLDSLTPESRLKSWERVLAVPKDRGCVLVIEREGVAGFGVFDGMETLPDWAIVASIYLDPAHIGTGAGRLLMDAGLERLASYGYQHVELWVHPLNERARRFYEAGGWWADGTSKMEKVWDIEVPEIRYVRPLRLA